MHSGIYYGEKRKVVLLQAQSQFTGFNRIGDLLTRRARNFIDICTHLKKIYLNGLKDNQYYHDFYMFA